MRKITMLMCSAAILAGCKAKISDETTNVADKPKLSLENIERNPTKNAYFGDLHVHTKNSFDASIVGTKTTADDAYRFAQGEAIDNGSGQSIQLSGPPLDFYGVTDHGEYMGIVAAMRDRSSRISKTKTAKSIFGLLAGSRDSRTEAFIEIGTTIVTGEPIEDIYDREFIDSAWAENVAAAEKHNRPGEFTTFSAYEFTSMRIIGDIDANLGATNLHRNVVFKDKAPTRLFTTLDSPNPEELWEWMNTQRGDGIDVISIPHNSNGSNGGMFDLATDNGSALTGAYAENRIKNEPIVEMTQVKGTSETHPALSPEDEWADHELYEILIGMPVESTKVPGSFVRQSLARGIELEEKLGTNPYKFGFIGSTDAHVSASSLSEEDFFGKFSSDLDIESRGSIPPDGKKDWGDASRTGSDFIIQSSQYGASGLAGVWAQANTREDIFAAMQSKETFATSGPRIKVRMFAGDYESSVLDAADMVNIAYENGTPMGTDIAASTSPDFLLWALQDPEGIPLQRLQIIKTWPEAGEYKEAIYDVACAKGATPDPATHRCPENGAAVDLSTCATNNETGTSELKALWKDPDFKSGQAVAYYLRVIENPKCRWSTWDAVRNGTPPNPDMKALVQDRAWGSPIWVKGQ